MKYLIIIEETSTGFSAYCPDIPGCVAGAETEEETKNTDARSNRLAPRRHH